MTKLQTVDGFVYRDCDKGAYAIGPVRAGKKVLLRTAVDLAREATYTLAIFEVAASGGSAGVNASPESRDEAVSAFAAEIAAGDGSFRPLAGTGFGEAHLSVVRARHADPSVDQGSLARATAAMAVTAAGTGWKEAAIVGASAPELSELLRARHAKVTELPDLAWDCDVDVLFAAGGTGALDHHAAELLNCRRVVGLTPLICTARGLAVAARRGAAVMPSFISAAGPLVAAEYGIGADEEKGIRSLVARVSAVTTQILLDPSPFRRACEIAEAFVASWMSQPLFGRPLAP